MDFVIASEAKRSRMVKHGTGIAAVAFGSLAMTTLALPLDGDELRRW